MESWQSGKMFVWTSLASGQLWHTYLLKYLKGFSIFLHPRLGYYFIHHLLNANHIECLLYARHSANVHNVV